MINEFNVDDCVKIVGSYYNNATCKVVSVNNDNTLTVHCVGMPPNNHLTLEPIYLNKITQEEYNNVNFNHHVGRRSKSLRNKLKKLHKSKRRKKSYRRSYQKTKVKRSKNLRRKNKFK